MLETLKNLQLNTPYPLVKIHERLIETNKFSGDLATLVTLLWKNENFALSLPHSQPPETFTIKRTKDYE